MLQQDRDAINKLSQSTKECPQSVQAESQIHRSEIEQNLNQPKPAARVYPFHGHLQMKLAPFGFRASEKAASAEKMLVISCADYQPIYSNPVSYWLDKARNIQSFGNSLSAYREDNPDIQLLESMILSLQVKDIIILGHTGCKAMQCLLADACAAHPKKHSAMALTQAHYSHLSAEAQAEVMVQENVLIQMENLLSYPRLAQAVEQKKLQVHAWIFESETGKFYSYDVNTGQFEEHAANRDVAIGM